MTTEDRAALEAAGFVSDGPHPTIGISRRGPGAWRCLIAAGLCVEYDGYRHIWLSASNCRWQIVDQGTPAQAIALVRALRGEV